MTVHSRRSKLRHNCKSYIEHLEKGFVFLKRMDDIAAGDSEHVTANLKELSVFLHTYVSYCKRFRETL